MFYLKKDSMNSITDSFNNMFSGFMVKCMKTNIEDCNDSYKIYCEVPGVPKDKIDVSYSDDMIYISVDNEHNDSNKEYIIKERCIQSIRRSFYLENADPNGIKAELKDGVLSITINKLDNNPQKRIIDID